MSSRMPQPGGVRRGRRAARAGAASELRVDVRRSRRRRIRAGCPGRAVNTGARYSQSTPRSAKYGTSARASAKSKSRMQLQAVGGGRRRRHAMRLRAEHSVDARGDVESMRRLACAVDAVAPRARRRASRAGPPTCPRPARCRARHPRSRNRTRARPRRPAPRVSRRAPARARTPGCARRPDRGAAARARRAGARAGGDASRAARPRAGSARRDQSSRADANVSGAAGSGGSARAWNPANSAWRPRRTASISAGSPWSTKYGNGLRLAVLLAHEQQREERREQRGRRREPQPVRGRRSSSSRSPIARLPIWSWFWANTTKRCPGSPAADRPKRWSRNGEYRPA